MKGWVSGEKANAPSGAAQFGEAVFTYSDSENGVYTSAVPSSAGTWYVKATVAGTDNYTGLEKKLSFDIRQKNPAGSSGASNDNNPKGPAIKNDAKTPTSGTAAAPETVRTSDSSSAGFFVVMSILSAGCLILLTGKKRKRV